MCNQCRDQTCNFQAGSKEFSADNQSNDGGEHSAHGLEDEGAVGKNRFVIAASDEFNDDSKDPNEKQSRDGIELNSRINELTEDDHQCDRKDRKDSVPGGNIAKVVFLGQDGVRIDVVVLLVIVLLNKVMADSNNDQSRDGNRKLALNEVDDRIQTGCLSSKVSSTGGWP